jgi:hypothetical protein
MLRILTVLMLLGPANARADPAAANACAGSLLPDAKTIYGAVTADFAAGNSQPDVRATVIGLVQAGKIDRAGARDNAMAAAACLKQWK